MGAYRPRGFVSGLAYVVALGALELRDFIFGGDGVESRLTLELSAWSVEVRAK
jgi:hypothetical protein